MGLLEDADRNTRQLWGNFPQTYSMVGLIKSAMKLSKPWEVAFEPPRRRFEPVMLPTLARKDRLVA